MCCSSLYVYGYYQLVLSFDLFLVLLCDCYKLSQGSGSTSHVQREYLGYLVSIYAKRGQVPLGLSRSQFTVEAGWLLLFWGFLIISIRIMSPQPILIIKATRILNLALRGSFWETGLLLGRGGGIFQFLFCSHQIALASVSGSFSC